MERRLGPNLPGKPISLISAAAMDYIIRDGTPAYFLHISAVLPDSDKSKTPIVSACDSPEVIRGSSEPSEPTGEPLGIDKMSRKEEEELLKHIPEKYRDYLDVFSSGKAKELPPHCPYDLKIKTEGDSALPFGKLYNMSETELKALKDYIDDMLGKGFIRASNSPAGAPVLFIKRRTEAYNSVSTIGP